MKVAIDPDKLLAEGRITAEEHRRILSFAKEETGSLAHNVLIAFGVIAIAGGVLALLHSIFAAVILGLVVEIAGVIVVRSQPVRWGLLGTILTMVGTITAGGGIVKFSEGEVPGFAYVTIICAAGAYYARSGLLAALTAIALAGVLGASTAYEHATYWFCLQRPALTVLVFGILSWAAYRGSLRLDARHAPLAVMFSRTCLFLVNLGFWIGSLWGDDLWHKRDSWDWHSGRDVPYWLFSVVWALAMVATGVWAARRNRRWVVNLMAVFGSIHFYTQYFERLGAHAGSLITAGVIALGIAMLIARYNRAAPRPLAAIEAAPTK
jgi:iron complex transport system permease protein